jgi:hypothetical protein
LQGVVNVHPLCRSAIACLAVVLAVLASGPAPAQTDPGTTAAALAVTIDRDSTYKLVDSFVYNGPVAYVRLEKREPGSAPNAFPYVIDPATLRAVLVAMQLPSSKKEPQLFDSAELDEIVQPLATALGRATPEEDVCFAVSGRHGPYGVLTPRSVTTARLFTKDGRLQMVFGLVRHDWDSAYHGTGVVLPFEPGHRAAPIKNEPGVAIAPDLGTSARSDWIDLAPASALAAAGAARTPAPAAAPGAAAPAAVAPPPASTPAAISDRLRTLKKLHDDGLITDQEYDAKRHEILQQL